MVKYVVVLLAGELELDVVIPWVPWREGCCGSAALIGDIDWHNCEWTVKVCWRPDEPEQGVLGATIRDT